MRHTALSQPAEQLHEALALARQILEKQGLGDRVNLVSRLARCWSQQLPHITREHPLRYLQALITEDNLQRSFGSNQEWAGVSAAVAEAADEASASVTEEEATWRSVTISTEVPSLQVRFLAVWCIDRRFAYTSPQILSDGSLHLSQTSRVGIGEPIEARLTLGTSFIWAVEGKQHLESHGQRMSYGLQANTLDWVVQGRCAGEFLASVRIAL